MRALYLSGVLLHGLLHAQGGIAGAHGVVLMRQRCPKQGHDAIAHDLIDSAFVLVHGRQHAVENWVEQLPRLLRVAHRHAAPQAPAVVRARRDTEGSSRHRDVTIQATPGSWTTRDAPQCREGATERRGRALSHHQAHRASQHACYKAMWKRVSSATDSARNARTKRIVQQSMDKARFFI